MQNQNEDPPKKTAYDIAAKQMSLESIWEEISEEAKRTRGNNPQNWIEDLLLTIGDPMTDEPPGAPTETLDPTELKIYRATEEFINENGRKPRDAEIAKRVGVTREWVTKKKRDIAKKTNRIFGLDIKKPKLPRTDTTPRRAIGEALELSDLQIRLGLFEKRIYPIFLTYTWVDSGPAKARREKDGLGNNFVDAAVRTFAFMVATFTGAGETELYDTNTEAWKKITLRKKPIPDRFNSMIRFLAFLLFDKAVILKRCWRVKKIRQYFQEEGQRQERVAPMLRTDLQEVFGFGICEAAAEYLIVRPEFFHKFCEEKKKNGAWVPEATFRTYFLDQFFEWLSVEATKFQSTEDL